MLEALQVRMAVPAIAAYLPHVPRMNPYNGRTVAAPSKAAGNLSVARVLPPILRHRDTIQNHSAGKSIPLHTVLKTEGLGAVWLI
jgi:hypothetical protein